MVSSLVARRMAKILHQFCGQCMITDDSNLNIPQERERERERESERDRMIENRFCELLTVTTSERVSERDKVRFLISTHSQDSSGSLDSLHSCALLLTSLSCSFSRTPSLSHSLALFHWRSLTLLSYRGKQGSRDSLSRITIDSQCTCADH